MKENEKFKNALQRPIAIILFNIFFISLTLLSSHAILTVEASGDPSTLNGGSAMAMAGKGCVALAVDKRFGSGMQMVNVAPRPVLILHSHLMIAFTGLQGDVESVAEELSVQAFKRTRRGSSFGFPASPKANDWIEKESEILNQIEKITPLQQSQKISPRAMASLTSHILYSRRSSPYYCEPLVVGLEPIISSPDLSSSSKKRISVENNEETTDQQVRYRPFLCAQDLIGAQSHATDFACSGVAYQSMCGTAEAMWRPDMDPETLAQVCGKAFLSALERDCLSGYGAIVYVLTEDGGIIQYELDTRND